MIQIPNTHGAKVQAEGLRIVVTDNFIYIDTSQIQQNALMAKDPQMQIASMSKEEKTTAKKIQDSTLDTVAFFNKFFWG